MTSWTESKLGNVLTVIRGVSYKKEEARKERVDGYLPILRATNIQDRLTFDELVYVPSAKVSREQRLRKGDLVVAASSGSRAVVGKAAQLNEDWNGSFGAFCFGLRPIGTVDPRFVGWFLQTGEYRNRVSELAAGVNINNLRAKHIEEMQIRLPPRAEQQRIVTEIEKQFTRLDAGVASLKRVQIALKRYRASVLKTAYEGRLVTTEAELARKENRRYETAEQLLKRILEERRKSWTGRGKYKEPQPPVSAPTDELPRGWSWVSWDQVGFSQNGRPFKSAEYETSGFKLLRPGNLHVTGRVVWTDENTRYVPNRRAAENSDLIVRGGELVMNLTAQSLRDEFLGRICLTGDDEECLLNQRLARLTPVIILPKFVLYLLKAWRFRRFVDQLNTGSLIQHMFTSQLARFAFPLPPLSEQGRIVDAIERLWSASETVENSVSSDLRRTNTLRHSILNNAFRPQTRC